MPDTSLKQDFFKLMEEGDINTILKNLENAIYPEKYRNLNEMLLAEWCKDGYLNPDANRQKWFTSIVKMDSLCFQSKAKSDRRGFLYYALENIFTPQTLLNTQNNDHFEFLIGQLFRHSKSNDKINSTFELLLQNEKAGPLLRAINIYVDNLDKDEKENFYKFFYSQFPNIKQKFQDFIPYLVLSGNAYFLSELQHFDPALFTNIKDDQLKLINEMIMFESQIRKLPDKKQALALSFDSTLGLIDYEAGLLTCAAIKANHKDYFNPTLLNSYDEMYEYLNVLQNSATLPLRERFILRAKSEFTHWIAGDVMIDKNGHVSLAVFDSLKEYGSTQEMMLQLKNLFPDITIYYPQIKRQGTDAGCSVFALDDVRHLYTVEKFLPSTYKETGLFGYLADNSQALDLEISHLKADNTFEIFAVEVQQCPMPLYMERTLQSRKLFNELTDSKRTTELELPINKKGEKFEASIEKHFHAVNIPEGDEQPVKANYRLQDKFKKMARVNIEYLSNPNNDFEKDMQQFTLASLKNRITTKNDSTKKIFNTLGVNSAMRRVSQPSMDISTLCDEYEEQQQENVSQDVNQSTNEVEEEGLRNRSHKSNPG